MTEPNDSTPTSDSNAAKEAGKPDAGSAPASPAKVDAGKSAGKGKVKKPKVKQPGRWRRRIVGTFMFLIVAGLAIQILLWCLLPWTLRRAAKFYDLDLTCDRPDLSLFNSDAGLWHVKVTQHGQMVANVDYCRADISILNLLRGKLIIQRLEADGVELTVQRDADGSIPLLKSILFAGPQPGAAPVKKAPGTKPGAIDLRAPVAIDALVLTHVRTHIIDKAVTPELNTEVQMNLRLTDLASPERPPKFSMQLIPSPLSTPLLDSVVIEAGAKKVNDSQSLSAYFNASARGLHPKLLGGYLAPFGVKVTADGVAMAARGTIDINVMPTNSNAVSGSVKFTALGISADNQDAATMKSLSIDIDSLGANSAVVGKVSLADGAFLADRTAAGGFRVAGFEFTPGAANDSTAAPVPANATQAPAAAAQGAKPGAAQSVATAAPAAPSAAADPAATPFVWALNQLTLTNFRASFKDAAVKPAADLEFVINDLTLKNLTNDPAKEKTPIAITGDFAAPGILRDVKINGACQAVAAKKTFDLNVVANGIHPDALGPYFAMMGIDSDLKSAQFTCELSADLSQPTPTSIAANARLANIKFEDGRELLALDDVKLSAIAFAPGAIKIGTIEVTGPRAAARREKNGAIWAAGFRLKPSPAKPAGALAAAPAVPSPATATHATAVAHPSAPPANLAALPKIDIGLFKWTGVQLRLDDDEVPEGAPTSVGIEDAGIELTGLHVDFDPKAPAAIAPAKLHAYLKAPGVAGNIDVIGTIAQKPAGMTADLQINGEGLSAKLATPYLKAMNVQPTLVDGAVRVKAHLDVAQLDDGIGATVRASDFKLSDSTGELLGADEASIDAVHMTADALEVGAVTLDKPRGQFSRDENGAVNAVGFRLVPVPPTPKKSAFTAAPLPTLSNGPAAAAAATALPAGAPPATQPAAPPQVLTLKKFSIHGGQFAWTDRAVKPTAQIVAHVDGDLDGAVWGKPADPTKLSFTLKADGIVNEAKLAGTLTATPESAAAKLDISAVGLKQGALVSYLPPGMTIELKDGSFITHVDANLAVNPKGGAGGTLVVSALDYHDGNGGPPLFSLEKVNVAVPRVDIAGGTIEVDDISMTGAQSSARRGKDGVLHAMGIAIAPATQPAVATTQPAASAQAVASTQPAINNGHDGAPNAPATATVVAETDAPDKSPAAPALVIVKPKYPLITIKKLDVGLKRFSFTDESREGSPPVVVSELHLLVDKPIVALGKDAANLPATQMLVSLKVDDVIDALKVDLKVAPFAGEPWASVSVYGSGIHGDGLIAQVPELKSQIDAAALTDGRLTAHFGAKLKLDRFDPLQFPLDRAFDVDASIRGVEFRASEKGEVLVGVEEIRSEGIHVHPAAKTIFAKTLEVENIIGRATREKDGIHALGVVLKVPATQPATQPAASVATAAPAPAPKAAVAATPAATGPSADDNSGEIRIGKVFVSGLDFRLEDNTVSPPLIVPLNQLDVDIRNLSSKAMTEVRPATRFSVLVGAGKVPLPRKDSHAPAVAVSLPGIGAKPAPKKSDLPQGQDTEMRDLFSQVQADGEMIFYPKPKGWLKTSVSAFDLASITSTVKAIAPVSVYNGVFDMSLDSRFPGDGSMVNDLHLYFTDLDFAEPSGGPLQKFLVISFPMDVVVGALERPDGSIDIPVGMTLKEKQIGMDQVGKAIGGAIFPIVRDAVAAAPVKAVNTVTNVAGAIIPFSAIFGAPKPVDNGPFTLGFAAGDDALSYADQVQLAFVIQRMKEEPEMEITLRGDLTGGSAAASNNLDQMAGDVGRGRARANPTQEECRELINRLSRRKDDLIRRRLDVLGQARSAVVSRAATDAAPTLERLRAVERELSATEEALDRLYELERPGANRQAGRRTKQAALAVVRSRQKAIAEYLQAGGIADAGRIKDTRPQFNPQVSNDFAGGSVVITVNVKKK